MKTVDIVVSLRVQTDLILRIKKVERETHTHRQTHRLTDREYLLLSEISLKKVSTI